jgi:hypothetical protein
MVMLAEGILTRLKPKREFRQRSLESIPEDKIEDGILFEYDERTGEQGAWEFTMPLRILMTNLPVTARWSPNYPFFRWLWAGLGSVLVFLLAFAILILPLGPIIAILPAVPLAAIGAAVGYATGHLLAPSAFWTARRIWREDGVEIWPLTHTMLKGETPLVAAGGNGAKPKEAQLQVAGFAAPPPHVYVPRIYRATTLFEDLKMRTERANMRAPKETWQKIELGVVVMLAAGLVLGLIFVIAVTTK